MREVSQVHLCSCLFSLFEDFLSHSAPNDIRRQHILKWTKWHIKWACRSYCNSIWVVSGKSGISSYLVVTSCGLPFTIEEQRLIPSTILDQLSDSYGSVTIMVQTHQETVHENCPAEVKQHQMKQESFYTHALWKRRHFTTVITIVKLEEIHQTKDSQEGKNRAELAPSITFPQTCKSPFLI